MVHKDREAVIDVPGGYSGPDRRLSVSCGYHLQHQRILEDHDGDLAELRRGLEQQRRDASSAHGDIYTELKGVDRAKVSNKLFYLFISAYSLLFIAGIVSVYKQATQATITFQEGIADVKLMQTELRSALKNAEARIADINTEVRDLKADIRNARRP
jgi:hypothetical protein